MLFNDKILIRSFLFSSLIAMMLMFAGCTNNRECEIGDSKINDEDIDFSVTDEQINDELKDSNHVDEVEISNDREIVWLGDSLTQGSLGHDGDNINNSPAIKLQELSGHNVDGYGFYGYNTHDIFWVYRDETQKNQKVDPNKIYLFWVGSNDWVVDGNPNDDVGTVTCEIDKIIEAGGLSDYLVIGTTARYELRTNNDDGIYMYESVNNQLSDYYKDHYLDVIDAIAEDGYGPDQIHLTQEAYDNVALLVHRKLIDMNYIK